MSILRNFFIVCGLLIFAATAGAATDSSVESQNQNSTEKVVTAKKTKKTDEVVNINSADAATLQKVKGIGKKKSQAIVDYRATNGTFTSVEDLLKIKALGINKKWLDKVSKYLKV